MSKPTKEDASLFLQFFAIIRHDKDFMNAYQWLSLDLDIEKYEEFAKKYPRGSQGRIYLNTYAGFMEILSTFVNHEIMNEDLIFDLWGSLFWEKMDPLVQGMREELKFPRLYENYEVFAKRYPKWAEEHPPKV